MFKKYHSSEITSSAPENTDDFLFLITSIDKHRPLILNEDDTRKEKIKRNKSINPRFYSIKEINKLSSNDTPKKKKPRNKKGKSVKFKIFNSESNIPEKVELIPEYIKDQNPFEEMLITSHNKKKSSKKKYLIQLKLPNKLIKEINSLSLNIIYPMDNRYGMFDKYYQSIKDSLRQISPISFNAIFSLENNKNVNYLVYEPTYNENGFKKKLLLLDLDETLIHSEIRNKNNFHILNKLKDKANCYHKVFSYIDNNYLYYFDIFFRPHLFDFLHEIQNYFDIGIFTASSKGYADTIIDYIDPSHTIFNFRLYRDACIPIQNSIYIKDLRIIRNYEANNVILLDNSLYSFINQPKNGMLVYSFYWDDKDDQLIKAKNFLIKYLYKAKDVREELDKWYYYNEFKRK